MSVRRRRWRDPTTGTQKEAWVVDVGFTAPDGKKDRVRKTSPVPTRRGAEEYERQLRGALLDGSHFRNQQDGVIQTPKLDEFFPTFIKEHFLAQKLKHGTVEANKSIYRLHISPLLGSKRLDELTNKDVATLKLALTDKSKKTINCVLGVLSKCLKVAVDLGVIDALPFNRVKLLKAPVPVVQFYEVDEYTRLVEGARATKDPRVLALIALGGQAGLRDGEMMGLEWGDVDMKRGVITISRAIYKGVTGEPKSGKHRRVEMTSLVKAALEALPRGVHSAKVLQRDGGGPTTHTVQRRWVEAAERAAGMPVTGRIHVLRHTFCSHLAMRGAPAVAIKELAGHLRLSTTQQYMHLAPQEKRNAISLLNLGTVQPGNGTWTAQKEAEPANH